MADDDPTVGIYLENVEGSDKYQFDEEYIVANNPGRLLLLIPSDLATGLYRLKVVTQFTSANKLLNAPHQAIFGQELTVV
ncbi:MAG: DUF4469 domain-containing protein [Tannerella sp.]|nr:DUF4469 domain-containing protein [Tannerella sp.]